MNHYLKNMPLEDKVSQLFFVDPEAFGLKDPGEITKELLTQYPIGGIILFKRHIKNEAELRAHLSDIKKNSKYPLFLGVDEEGGRIAEVANSEAIKVPSMPAMGMIGASGQTAHAAVVGKIIGSYLKDLGFNVNFAPVADVASNPENPVIGSRSFGSDPHLVAKMVTKEVKAMQQHVSATLKHFPGHGDTREDSHAKLAVLNRTIDELRAVEFVPFQAGIKAGADFVMAGHLAVPKVTRDSVPATMSKIMITDHLRGELGYEGIVITDSMRMGAIVNHYGAGEAAVRVLQAGVDMILMTPDFAAARKAVIDSVKQGLLTEERIDESLKRIYKAKK